MDQLRINEKNKIRIELNDVKKNIERNNETIKRLSNIQEHVEFYNKQITKLENKNIDDSKIAIELEKKLLDIDNGLYDHTINLQISNNNNDSKMKQEASDKKCKLKKDQKQEDRKKLDLEYKTFRKHDGISAYGMQKETDRFFFNMASIPDYMKQNLKTMPCNKGYIWKGIHFMGSLKPENNNVTIMFEKCRGGIMKIHEITRRTHIIYEKQGKNQKKLVSNVQRNPILSDKELKELYLLAKS